MKYSIIVCSYNSATTLINCLESVASQTYTNYEIIFIDDGSTDKTKDIINKCSIHNKIRYYYQKNSGIAIARNKGIQKATGEYLLFLDSDDTLNPNLLKKIDEYLRKFSCDIIRYNANRIENNRILRKKYFLKSFSPLKGTDAILHFINSKITYGPLWLYCYNRSFLFNLGIFFKLGTIHEDFLNCLWLAKANSIGGISYIGYNYHKNSASITDIQRLDIIQNRFRDIIYYYDYVIKNLIPLYQSSECHKKKIVCSSLGFLINSLKYFKGTLYDCMVNEIKKRDVYNIFKEYK